MINWKLIIIIVLFIIAMAGLWFHNSPGYAAYQHVQALCEDARETIVTSRTKQEQAYLTGQTRKGDLYGHIRTKLQEVVNKEC